MRSKIILNISENVEQDLFAIFVYNDRNFTVHIARNLLSVFEHLKDSRSTQVCA